MLTKNKYMKRTIQDMQKFGRQLNYAAAIAKTYAWHELNDEAQENATGLYYHDSEYQNWAEANPDTDGTPALFSDAAPRMGWLFNEHGIHVANKK
jgi:hypothetical protein